MSLMRLSRWMVGVAVCLVVGPTPSTWGNGGPFLLKYPNGDPAARGNVALLDVDLKPSREERLRVIKEDLKIAVVKDPSPAYGSTENKYTAPLAIVSAEYTIENPTTQNIEVHLGFPILRGIYEPIRGMSMAPEAHVIVNGKDGVHSNTISNSAIYGLIRSRAREVIETAVAGDPALAERVAAVRTTGTVRRHTVSAIRSAVQRDEALKTAVARDRLLSGIAAWNPDALDDEHKQARLALADYLNTTRQWNARNVALMVEYASVDLGPRDMFPRMDQGIHAWSVQSLPHQNIGALHVIGEQRVTQLLATLAGAFDPKSAAQYESIFAAWGGDVREKSVDLETGQTRPREITVDPNVIRGNHFSDHLRAASDPTVYARVDYLDPKAQLSEALKSSCQTILKNLPVVFTFAPMNLLHFQVKFPPNATTTLKVTYRQYAYKDTHEPASYQVAYLVHPASFWKDFGPINLDVATPIGINMRASVPCQDKGTEDREVGQDVPRADKIKRQSFAIHQAVLKDKTGELFVGVDAGAWDQMAGAKSVAGAQPPARK